MRNKFFTIFFPLSILVALSSCNGKTGQAPAHGDTVTLRHAETLTIESRDGYTLVTLADPWNEGRTLHTYTLLPRDAEMPDDMPPATVIRTPVERAVVATSVHCALITELGCGASIAGVCDLQYINLPRIKEQCEKGLIADCGNGMSPTIEKVIELAPDAIFLSPFQNSGGYGRVEETGIPIVEMSDYMETSPLGRAEWMRFYGMLFGAEQRADSLFGAVEERYNALATAAAASPKGRSVLIDKMMGSVWYVPGGHSTIGRLIADANAAYAWADDERSGSIALSFESVLEKGADADVWLVRYYGREPLTAASMLSENKGYGQFKAFRNGDVYCCNTAVSTFYEDTPFHPDRLLRDFIIITHPDMTGQGETEYFRKLTAQDER